MICICAACGKRENSEKIELSENDERNLKEFISDYLSNPTTVISDDKPEYIFYIAAYKMAAGDAEGLTYDEATNMYCLPKSAIEEYIDGLFDVVNEMTVPNEFTEKDGYIYFTKYFIPGGGLIEISDITVNDGELVTVMGNFVDEEGNVLEAGSDLDGGGYRGSFTAVVKCIKTADGYSYRLRSFICGKG